MSTTGRQYHIHEALGRGGFGTVYRAELRGESGFSKAVALKVLNPEMEHVDEIARRFRDEARVLGLVRHRSIVHVDGLARLTSSNGTVRWAVVMELIEGCHIGGLLRSGSLPPRVATEITGEVAAALHAAWHRKNAQGRPLRLLHRDIKPGNIQVTAEGEVKVLDFGIARADFAQREAETRSVIFGTKGYMAPERMALAISPEDGEEGPEGDVYSLGVVLYEMLTSQRFEGNPLQPEDHLRRLHAAQDEVYSQLGEESEALVRLLGRMLDFEPTERPSARELMRACAELRSVLGAESLMDWAEHAVPAARASQDAPTSGQMTGETLVEEQGVSAGVVGLSAPEPPAALPAKTRAALPMWPFILLGVGLMVVTGGVLMSAVLSELKPDEPAADAPLVEEPVEAAVEVVEPAAAEPEVREEPEPAVEKAAPQPRPVAVPEPTAPEPTAPEPQPTPGDVPEVVAEPVVVAEPEVAEPSGSIQVTGSATNVVFVTPSGQVRRPGEMPPGTYTIKADFGAGQVVAGSVSLLDGQHRRFSCVAEFTLCREL